MSTVVHEDLIPERTAVAPGTRYWSPIVSVGGAREVSVLIGILQRDPSVRWTIYFGPAIKNGYVPVRTGTFGASNQVSVSLPVLGTEMCVVLSNEGTASLDADGVCRLIHEDAAPSNRRRGQWRGE